MNGGLVRDLLSAEAPRSVRVDWDRVEAWLGTGLPTDYRDMADRFGSLFVGDWLWVHAPVRLADHPSFDKELAGVRSEARDACDASGLPAPGFHPKKGGLLPFGSGRGGEGLFWDTTAPDPDAWPVVVLAHARGAYGNASWIHTGLPLVPFLEALMTTGVGTAPHALGPLPARVGRTYGDAATSRWTPPDRAARNDPRRKALTTGSGLAALTALVPPAVDLVPVAADDGLPADYRALMETYGAGTWRGWLRVQHPDELESESWRRLSEAVAPLRNDDFLPFADSIDGDVLGWVRTGQPDRWPLAWVPRHAESGPAMGLTLTQALLAWLRGTPVDAVFASPDPDVDLVDQATFAPVGRPAAGESTEAPTT
ncbi:hypothetical protein GCM10011376_18630 [Nocardioides flavus (ex Wang et al. 2016)]|uniref:SMI1/KNR4 family protein n=1 Tax=Nocardioides flavus (ex Wang et al. 2016) TaxID=2058780 RepID=A0ABQ3HK17_9ACTN|nr:SMI1/KNR4 family protein [Nocardioides flavus (ex Wang et al. 2016)]GHE17253.1 hypothetical protein GCM10011376_18630 [Nocardioides flavus (ex Wang et al. 2016)]